METKQYKYDGTAASQVWAILFFGAACWALHQASLDHNYRFPLVGAFLSLGWNVLLARTLSSASGLLVALSVVLLVRRSFVHQFLILDSDGVSIPKGLFNITYCKVAYTNIRRMKEYTIYGNTNLYLFKNPGKHTILKAQLSKPDYEDLKTLLSQRTGVEIGAA